MDITQHILPMTTFRNRSAEIMQHLRDTGRLVVLTVSGKAAAVVQDAEAYRRLLDVTAETSAAEGIREGLDPSLARNWPRSATNMLNTLILPTVSPELPL